MYNRKSAMVAALLSSLLLATLLPSAPATAGPPAHQGSEHEHSGGSDGPPPNDHKKGMVFDGLRPGKSGEACHGAFQVGGAEDGTTCTPGPDPAPADVDVREKRSAADLAGETSGTAAEGGSIACIGDGTGGNRVQAIYAVASDVADRYGSIAPLIPQWAVAADAVYNNSAAQTGGTRHVRWVTNPDCSLSILKVVLSPTGDDSFANTRTELTNQGFTRTDRAYLLWSDANVYCGIGSIWIDDRPGQDNNNNGGRAPRIGRTDNGCWGRTNSTEAHELMHNLGGVQHTAPHSTGGFHCTDENDRMCYADDPGVVMSMVCPSVNETRFDCGHDDYFHSSPAPDSYLGTHWNVANSSFLTREAPSTTPPPTTDTTAPATPGGLTALAGDRQVSLSWQAVSDPDLAGYRVLRNGVVVADVSTPSRVDTGLINGTSYTYAVASYDTSGNQSPASASVSATPTAPAPSTTKASFSGTFTRRSTSARFQRTAGSGQSSSLVRVTQTGGNQAAPTATPITLELFGPDGRLVGRATGSGSATLPATLARGTHTWVVSGEAKVSYSLDIEYVTP